MCIANIAWHGRENTRRDHPSIEPVKNCECVNSWCPHNPCTNEARVELSQSEDEEYGRHSVMTLC